MGRQPDGKMGGAQIFTLLALVAAVAVATTEKKDEKADEAGTRGLLGHNAAAQVFGTLGGSTHLGGAFGGSRPHGGGSFGGSRPHGGGGFGGSFGGSVPISGHHGESLGGPIGPISGQHGQCKKFCQNHVTKQFYPCCCPVVRSSCPGVRHFGPPVVCTTNDQCYKPGEVCCEDACFNHRVCKPSVTYG